MATKTEEKEQIPGVTGKMMRPIRAMAQSVNGTVKITRVESVKVQEAWIRNDGKQICLFTMHEGVEFYYDEFREVAK